MAIAKSLEGAREDNVLTLLCWDADAAPVIAMQLTPELFSTREYQRLAAFAIDHIAKYGIPPRDHLRDYLEKEIQRREGTFLRQIIDAMETLYPKLQGQFVQADLDRFIVIRQMALAMGAAFDALDKDDIEGARDALYSASAAVRPTGGVWLHDSKKWFSFLNRQGSAEFSSGIPIFDERGIHPARKELYLHIGPRKSGKTWKLIQIGRLAVQMRHDVLHVTLENSSDVTQERYTQAFLQLTKEQTRTLRVPLFDRTSTGRFQLSWDQFDPGQLTDASRDTLEDMIKPYQFSGRPGSAGRLLVQEFPTGTLTLAQLNHLLDHLERTEKFKPDIVILDYINLMQLGDVRQHRLSLGRMGVELRGLAVARNLALATATQSNRQSAKARTVTGTHVAEDWSLLGTADTVVTYSQTVDEHKHDIARMFVDAARNAPDKWIAQISQSYATGQFCIDSIFMSKDVEEEMARHFGEDEDADVDHADADHADAED